MTKGNGKAKKTTKITTGELVAQKHGGALRNGGTNKGGPGRPPSKVRQRCRDSFEERLPFLEGVVDDDEERMSERLKAQEMLGRFGGVDKVALTVDEQPETEMTPERRLALWEQLQRIKTVEEFERLLVGAAKKQGVS